MLRVSGGCIRGRLLIGPKGLTFRPTTARVREFIFYQLGLRIVNAKILDLFAGTGILGIEALSRGASTVTFVDRSRNSLEILRKNLIRSTFSLKATILPEDVFSALQRLGAQDKKFDFIFADPPFAEKYRTAIVQTVWDTHVLHPQGILIVEHDIRDPDLSQTKFNLTKEKRFGDCVVSFYEYGSDI